MSPFDIATDGWLNSPLAVATSGYVCIVVSRATGGGAARARAVPARDLGPTLEQLRREDEEILAVIVAAVSLWDMG